MVNHTVKEINGAIKEFEDNPYRYENVSIESADIAIDCMRSCILDKRKVKKISDVQPVKRGKWMSIGNQYEWLKTYTCSECRHSIVTYKCNYCPDCGADMRGEDNG